MINHICNQSCCFVKQRNKQTGAALIIFFLVLILAGSAVLFSVLDSNGVKIERDKKTAVALAEAKAALLAYAATVNLTTTTCTTNCPRPGDLPCPDTDNDGQSLSTTTTSCGNSSGSTNQTLRLGRLPWKDLGLGDLRDGYGERLWYAVSTKYKNQSSRYRPLNSDTTGTITVRDASGTIIYNGASTATTGAVAVIFSAGPPLTRQDGVIQSRSTTAQQNAAINYLDNALGEDNNTFVDLTSGTNSNGFIMGPIKDVAGNEILNDRLLVITRDELLAAMETRVLAEASTALLEYYCGVGNVNSSTKTCISSGGNRFFPNPALFSDTTCLGNTDLSTLLTNCVSNLTKSHGRIPVNGVSPSWNSTSILRGVRNGNWFQLNAWREILHYAVAPACSSGTANCDGVGMLTLNNALVTPVNDKKVVLLASGKIIGTQTRSVKTSEANYFEGENLSPLDDVYVRVTPISNIMNDRPISIP